MTMMSGSLSSIHHHGDCSVDIYDEELMNMMNGISLSSTSTSNSSSEFNQSNIPHLHSYFSNRKSLGWKPRKYGISGKPVRVDYSCILNICEEDKENCSPSPNTTVSTISPYSDCTPMRTPNIMRFHLETPDSMEKTTTTDSDTKRLLKLYQEENDILRRQLSQKDIEIAQLKDNISHLENENRRNCDKSRESIQLSQIVTPRIKVASNRRSNTNVLNVKDCISIFCRVRPFTIDEMKKCGNRVDPLSLIRYDYEDASKLEIFKPVSLSTSTLLDERMDCSKYVFHFDRVFQPSSNQQDVFNQIQESLTKIVTDGFRCTIMCYGQTGSGKTYTIQGSEEEQGVLQQSINLLLDIMKPSMFLQVLFVEIYNEDTHNLLTSVHYKKDTCNFNQDEQYITITSKGHIFELLETARQNRAVASTENNLRSSRSHCIFRFRVVCSDTMQQIGALNIIDLAGSERLSETMDYIDLNSSSSIQQMHQQKKQRKSETVNINKSLSALSQVIKAMCTGQSFIDFRSSTLTKLLRDDLSYHQQTINSENSSVTVKSQVHMIVNIRPPIDPKKIDRTISSLQFAKTASTMDIVKLSIPQRAQNK
jgi:kinesin family protein C1